VALLLGPSALASARRYLLDFMVQGKMTKAATPTIQLGGATPSELIGDPPPSSPIFTLDALPAATLPLYPGLGQASNILACIPSGVVARVKTLQNFQYITPGLGSVLL